MSMRLIDADALLEQYGLKDATKYGNENAEQQHKSYSTLMMYEIADMIYDAPTIAPAANWTPCSVALPEKGVYVLGYLRVKEMKNDPMFIICKYYEGEDDDHFFDRDGWREDIIAWQPLPEPYRGEA